MSLFKKKTAPAVEEPMDLESVMKKYDRESNTRVWEGVPKLIVTCILATFSVFCIYHLFSTYSQKANRSLISRTVPSSNVTLPFQMP